nr:adhesion G protein-coupled receptor L4 [Meriones unguiculatus]
MRLLPLLVGFSTLLNCSYTQNCTKTPCLPNAKCEIHSGVEACFCRLGFSGNGVTICEDIDECIESAVCGDHAVCENVDGGFNCFCRDGYQTATGKSQFTPHDGSYCQDIDECIESAVCGDHAVCENVDGGFNCFCRDGYQTATGKSQFTPHDGSYCQESMNSNCHLEPACIAANVNKTLKRFGPMKEQMTLFQEIYRNSEAELSLMDVITYIEILAEPPPLLGHVNNTILSTNDYFNSTLTEFVKTINNFVQKNTLKIWDQLPSNHRRLHLTKLMHAAENITLKISQNFQKTAQFNMSSSDIALKVFVFDSNHMKHAHPHMNVDEGYVKIFPKRKASHDSTGNVVVAFLCYKSIGPLLSSSEKFSLDPQSDNSGGKEKVISSVISASISSNPPTLYELEKITFTLSHVKLSEEYRTQCAFWDYSADAMENGGWSSEGCELTDSNATHTSCRCSHLTHFLVCSIIAGLLHYFFLAAFAWMCIEGVHLYLIVVGVIYNKGFLHKNFYIFGYLSPAVVVGFSASLGYRYYGTTKVCWLSTENNFIWSFIGPACLIILVNLIAFGVIIYKVFRHTAGLKPEVGCCENIRSCARGALALLFLLGTTWIFGVLHVVHASVVTAYLFTVSNAFQGMFIFLFLCVLSRKIQEEYYRLFKNVPCCFGCLR